MLHFARLLSASCAPDEALDTAAVPTRDAKRRGDGWLAGLADIGWSSRLGWFEGVRLLLAVTPAGVITGFGLGPGSAKDQPLAATFFALRRQPHLPVRVASARLLLGLKGTMSEAELPILKVRVHEGRRAKAGRGEPVVALPRGDVLPPSGEIALDPDEQVQAVIRLVFDRFERRRSINGVLRYLVEPAIRLPDRLLARITELRRQGRTAAAIADQLNAEGWRPPKRAAFNAPMIRRLLQRYGLGSTRPIWSGNVPREAEDAVTLQELADQTGAHRQTVYGWLRRGRLKGRMVRVGHQRLWRVKRSASHPPSRRS